MPGSGSLRSHIFTHRGHEGHNPADDVLVNACQRSSTCVNIETKAWCDTARVARENERRCACVRAVELKHQIRIGTRRRRLDTHARIDDRRCRARQ